MHWSLVISFVLQYIDIQSRQKVDRSKRRQVEGIFKHMKQFLLTGVVVAAVLTKWLHRESTTRISMKPAVPNFSQSGRIYRALLRFRNKIPHKRMLYGLC